MFLFTQQTLLVSLLANINYDIKCYFINTLIHNSRQMFHRLDWMNATQVAQYGWVYVLTNDNRKCNRSSTRPDTQNAKPPTNKQTSNFIYNEQPIHTKRQASLFDTWQSIWSKIQSTVMMTVDAWYEHQCKPNLCHSWRVTLGVNWPLLFNKAIFMCWYHQQFKYT